MSEQLSPQHVARTAKNAAGIAAHAASMAAQAAAEAETYVEKAYDNRPMTAAELLGQLRRDLLDEGITGDLLYDLVRLAGQRVLDGGVTVGRAEKKRPAPAPVAAPVAATNAATNATELPKSLKAQIAQAEKKVTDAEMNATFRARENAIELDEARRDLAELRRIAAEHTASA